MFSVGIRTCHVMHTVHMNSKYSPISLSTIGDWECTILNNKRRTPESWFRMSCFALGHPRSHSHAMTYTAYVPPVQHRHRSVGLHSVPVLRTRTRRGPSWC